jgi:hypothetical protein
VGFASFQRSSAEEVFSNISNGSGPKPSTNTIDLSHVVEGDLQFWGYTAPTCPGINDNQTLDMSWTVQIGSTVYPIATIVHISKGNFNGILNVTSTITTEASMSRCFFCTVLLLTTSLSFGQQISDRVNTLDPASVRLPELKSKETSAERFLTIVTTAGASGGMAAVYDGCSYGPRRNVSIKEGTTLSQALDQLALESNSKWEMNEGVVNIIPDSSIPALLQTPIANFEWNRSKSIKEAVGQLLSLPEVTQRARELGLKAEPGGASLTGICINDCPKEPSPIIEVEKDTTLLAILNHIVGSHEKAIWGYFEFHCNNETRFTLGVLAE